MVPPLPRYCEALRLPVTLPAPLRFLRGAGTIRAPLFAPDRQGRSVRGPGLVTGFPNRSTRMEMTGSPKFLEDPHGRVPWSSTPAGPSRSATAALGCCLPRCIRRRLPRFTFRGSIPRPAPSLSTLRRVGCPTTTQDSLPAVGQRYRAGSDTRWVPMKGFSSRILLSQALLGANAVVLRASLSAATTSASPRPSCAAQPSRSSRTSMATLVDMETTTKPRKCKRCRGTGSIALCPGEVAQCPSCKGSGHAS